MTQFSNKTVLITGGASGIGKLMGQSCLQKGVRSLIIWDINQQALDHFVEENQSFKPAIHPHHVDISDPNQIHETSQHILNTIGSVDILINNAGIVVGKPFHKHSEQDVVSTLDINVKENCTDTDGQIGSGKRCRRHSAIALGGHNNISVDSDYKVDFITELELV